MGRGTWVVPHMGMPFKTPRALEQQTPPKKRSRKAIPLQNNPHESHERLDTTDASRVALKVWAFGVAPRVCGMVLQFKPSLFGCKNCSSKIVFVTRISTLQLLYVQVGL